MTFNENDPNRWLAPNTKNCINLLNKFKKGGAPCLFTSNQNSYRLQLNKWQAKPGQQPEAVMGSTGRPLRCLTRKEPLGLLHNLPASLLHLGGGGHSS